MSPSSREREYARRRYEDWQKKQTTRAQARLRRRNQLVAVGAVVAVLAVVLVVVLVTRSMGGSTAAATPAATTPAATTPAATTPAAAASAPAVAAGDPCPVPTVKAPAKPKSWASAPPASLAQARTWKVTLATSCGPIVLSLDGAKAPQGVSSTLFLARAGFYDDTKCHRLVTSGIFVLQCGDPTGTGSGGPGYSYGPVENAPTSNVYPAGTIAMARVGGNAKSMGSQFFLVYKDSPIPADSAGGYTVLGRIVTGLDIVDKIAAGGNAADGVAPARAISILSTTVAPG